MSAYLKHIATFTTWPDVPSKNSKPPILIGVVGADPNGVIALIKARVASKKGLLAQDRPIRVLDLQTPMDNEQRLEMLGSCELLFISEGAETEWARLQPSFSRLPIVTVSGISGFAERGGMIELDIERRTAKLRLKINLQVMHASGIILSARLLALESVILLREEDV